MNSIYLLFLWEMNVFGPTRNYLLLKATIIKAPYIRDYVDVSLALGKLFEVNYETVRYVPTKLLEDLDGETYLRCEYASSNHLVTRVVYDAGQRLIVPNKYIGELGVWSD